MVDPPLESGVAHRAKAVILPPAAPEEAVPMRAARGTVAGVTAPDRADSAPVPTALRAWTWNRTAMPLASPVTLRLVAPAAAGRRAPTWALAALTTRTENPVIAEPPLAGAVKRTSAKALPLVAVPISGAPGVVAKVTGGAGGAGGARVTAAEGAEKAPAPTAFVAKTWNW